MSEPAPTATASARPRRRGGMAVAWLLLAGLAVAAWVGWRWWQADAEARAAQAGQHARIAALEEQVDALRRDQRANAGRLQQAAATNRLLREELLGLGQRAALLEDSLAELQEGGAPGMRMLRMDEAELLLVTAAERLVAGDVEGARRAYALAAAVLERLDGPDVIDLRQALAQERAVLDAAGPDPADAARERLDAFAAALDALPGRTAPASRGASSWWQRLASRVVDVRPSGDARVVAPSERAAGLAALQVELALARAALAQRDEAAFDGALARLDAWLLRLWPASAGRRAQRQALRALREAPVRFRSPELGSTLVQLQRMRDG